MKNKIVAVMLSAVMAVSVLAGCGQENTPASSTESNQSEVSTASTDAVEETEPKEIAVDHFAGTTIKIAVVKKENDTCNDWNEKEIFKLAEEATGIHVEWTLIDAGVSADKVAVMLMGDDQPDVYLGALDENTLSANLDLFYDLSEEGLLETYAPKVVEIYDANPYAWDAVKWQDGSIRTLLTGAMTDADTFSSPLIINTEWLKKIGKEIPKTADELYEVLVAFRDGDMDGDGDTTDEIPLSFCSGFWDGDIMMHANPFGIASNNTEVAEDHYKSIKDGKVVSTVDTDNYRAFLEFYHKLYAEGLLDVEGFSQTADQYKAKRKELSIGVLVAYTSLMDKGYQPFIYQGVEGVEPQLSGLVGRFLAGRTNFAITADSENVEAVLHWWNWMHKDEETVSIAWGGSEYFYEENGEYYIASADTQPEGYNAATYGMHNLCPAFDLGGRAMSKEVTGKNAVRGQFYDENKHLVSQEGFPVAFGDTASAEERAFIEAELFPYIQTFTADAIVNGVTDASWEQHLKDLKTVQYYDWLQWYQDFVDEVTSR